MVRQRQNTALSPRQPFDGQRMRRIPGCFEIGTWNVQSLYTGGKIQNVVKEMIRLDVKIMGISETHWPSTGSCQIQEHMVYYSGNENPTHRKGVGIMATKEIKNFIP